MSGDDHRPRGQRSATGAGPAGSDSDAHGDRGQTTLDFAIGVSLFLGIVMLTFMIVPGTLDPFTEGPQTETVTVDRVADDLAHGLLGSPRAPGVLNRTCTVDFFENDTAASPLAPACPYEGPTTAERLGLTGHQNVNVTVQADINGTKGATTLCWTGEDLAERADCAGGSPRLRTGEPLPETNDASVTAIRTASLHRTDVTIVVEMW